MPKKPSPSTINQTAIGDGNVQVAGDNNTVNVNQTFIQKVSNFFVGDTEQQRAMRNRRAMLELVKNTWIKGVLEKSLYKEVLIELGMEERPSAVDHPWDIQIQMPDKPNRTIQPGTSIMQVFDEMNGAMLILGEPGSGKTTMLLELASACINRAQQDDNQPIPVVLNLSSWDGKQIVDDWLMNELNTKYNVSKKIGQDWVMHDDLQLLLDGLDEVKMENREACVKAINNFRQKHGLTSPIAICSRIADYEALTEKLSLQGAVFLQPLIPEQIDVYFEQVGSEFEAAHQILKNDRILQELVRQPLILSVMTLAYQGQPVNSFVSEDLDTIEIRRKQLFDTYIQQMFERVARTKRELYAREQTKVWLAWLAQRMIQHNAVPYLLEKMQPTWLGLSQRRSYKWSFGAMNGLVVGFILGLVSGVVIGLDVGIAGGILVGLLFGWGGFGMGAGLGVSAWRLRKRISREASIDEIEMIDALTWDWKREIKALIFGVITLLFGLIIGQIVNDFFYLLMGLVIAACVALVGGLRNKPVSRTIYPGQKIFFSARNFLFIFLLVGISTWLIFGLGIGLMFGVSGNLLFSLGIALIFALIVGLLFGLIVGSLFGGLAVVQHYTLRLILARNDLLPWRLIPFLDYCVDRIFLRRVGGGYIFVHRLLMEHFADMYSADEK